MFAIYVIPIDKKWLYKNELSPSHEALLKRETWRWLDGAGYNHDYMLMFYVVSHQCIIIIFKYHWKKRTNLFYVWWEHEWEHTWEHDNTHLYGCENRRWRHRTVPIAHFFITKVVSLETFLQLSLGLRKEW